MALIKVTDLAYGRLRSPDLDAMEEFLTEFGMVRAERTKTALYMRGTDPAHHIHVTEKGEPGFVGLAYEAASADDLRRVAKAPGASAVEALDEPGGGRRVRLREPNGYQIEVVYGIKRLKPIPVKRQPLNLGHEHLRRVGKYEHMWGIGRHLLGSQIYDYWADPWGRVHEHWSDTDRLNVTTRSNLLPVEEGFGSQWGERAPEKFIQRVCP